MTLSARRNAGFTLIEVMIVVAIVAILAAIAYPAYQDQVRKSRRAAAQSFLMTVAARQQQYLIDARTYATTLTALGLTTPTDVSPYYDVAFSATPTATTFNVVATPKAPQNKDLSGASLQLDQGGTKLPTGSW